MEFPPPPRSWRIPRPSPLPFNTTNYLPKNGFPANQSTSGSYLTKRPNMAGTIPDRRRFKV